MGRCDQGIKFCSKIQSARNHFKSNESVGLVVANPTQLVSSQTDVGSERYCDLFESSNRQKKGTLTVQSVQADVAGPYDRTLMWHVVMWQLLIGRCGRMVFRHVAVCGWWFGATWPSHGLPRGTFILVV
jgi:hypothetical protein